jgi:8-amino-3,8-dideoxy-alpha-D-manno-octulosonate transaminase
MDEAIYEKILHNLVDMDFKGTISPHFYGEPLLDKRLPKLMKLTREILPDVEIVVFTNGDFLEQSMYDLLVSNGVNKFIVTAHDDDALKRLKGMPFIGNCDIVLQSSIDIYKLNRGGLLYIPQVKAECCLFPSEYLVIDYLGNVLLCCNDYLSSNILGNIKSKSVSNIWQSEKYTRIREDLSNGNYSYGICKKCTE